MRHPLPPPLTRLLGDCNVLAACALRPEVRDEQVAPGANKYAYIYIYIYIHMYICPAVMDSSSWGRMLIASRGLVTQLRNSIIHVCDRCFV